MKIKILIFAILMSISAGCTNKKPLNDDEKLTCQYIKRTQNILASFALDNGTYPTTQEGLKILLSNTNPSKYPNYPQRPYYKRIPSDFWRTPLVYKNIDGEIYVKSLGHDKIEGTADDLDWDICSKKNIELDNAVHQKMFGVN